MLSQLDGPELITRVAVNSVKHVQQAKKAIEQAFRNQTEGKGFSLVEVLFHLPDQLGHVAAGSARLDRQRDDPLLSARRIQRPQRNGGDNEMTQGNETIRILIAGFGGQGGALFWVS